MDVGFSTGQEKTDCKHKRAAQVLGHSYLGNKESIWRAKGAMGCQCEELPGLPFMFWHQDWPPP